MQRILGNDHMVFRRNREAISYYQQSVKGDNEKNYSQLNVMGEGREGFLRILQSLIIGSSSYHGDTNKILHTL